MFHLPKGMICTHQTDKPSGSSTAQDASMPEEVDQEESEEDELQDDVRLVRGSTEMGASDPGRIDDAGDEVSNEEQSEEVGAHAVPVHDHVRRYVLCGADDEDVSEERIANCQQALHRCGITQISA